MKNGQERIFERSTVPIWYSETAQNTRAGAGTAKNMIASLRDNFSIARKRHYERLLLMLLARCGFCCPHGANGARCG